MCISVICIPSLEKYLLSPLSILKFLLLLSLSLPYDFYAPLFFHPVPLAVTSLTCLSVSTSKFWCSSGICL